jgi:hypothetical protein
MLWIFRQDYKILNKIPFTQQSINQNKTFMNNDYTCQGSRMFSKSFFSWMEYVKSNNFGNIRKDLAIFLDFSIAKGNEVF